MLTLFQFAGKVPAFLTLHLGRFLIQGFHQLAIHIYFDLSVAGAGCVKQAEGLTGKVQRYGSFVFGSNLIGFFIGLFIFNKLPVC